MFYNEIIIYKPIISKMNIRIFMQYMHFLYTFSVRYFSLFCPFFYFFSQKMKVLKRGLAF